jgi:hypothetical protein
MATVDSGVVGGVRPGLRQRHHSSDSLRGSRRDLRAHQISTATLLGIFAVYVWMLHRRWPIETNQIALAVGAIWAMLTLGFEFGFGHWVVGQSWTELLDAYNVADGRVWVLVPIWTMIAPVTMRALQQPRRP